MNSNIEEKHINKIYEDDLKEFPDFKTYISNLTELENYSFKDLTNREIYDKYHDLAKILPSVYHMLNEKEFNEEYFYRARIGIDKSKEDISLKQTFSYPPTTFCNENQRANLKNKSVFYCSNNPNCAMLEVKPEIGSEGFLSVWKGNAKKPVKLGILLSYDLPSENEWNLMAKSTFQFLEKSLQNEVKDKILHFMALYKFIPDRFVKEEKPYYLTSMISNELLYNQWRDFIIYPSVASKTYMCNMAFHPNFVNENLEFVKVIKYKVNDIKNEQVKFNLGKVGYLQENHMVWRDATKEETALFKKE